jgi:hypothetical protein
LEFSCPSAGVQLGVSHVDQLGVSHVDELGVPHVDQLGGSHVDDLGGSPEGDLGLSRVELGLEVGLGVGVRGCKFPRDGTGTVFFSSPPSSSSSVDSWENCSGTPPN